MLSRVQPTAIQRGQTIQVTIGGTQNFAGASALLFEGSGLSGEIVIDPPKGNASPASTVNQIQARITASDGAALGPREFRVVTPQGVSSTGVLVVVAESVVAEADDKANDAPNQAQKVSLPAVLTGAISKVEDVDWYAFDVEAGQTLTFSVWGNRLQNVIHDLQTHLDPIIQLHDESGRELVASDNRDYADPLLTYHFEKSGRYFLQIRDTTYAGNPNWTYVLIATPGPYATSAFPMAVRPGETAELQLAGAHLDSTPPTQLEVPADTRSGVRLFPLPTPVGTTPPFPLLVTELPIALEADETSRSPNQPRGLSMPIAWSGRIREANEIDEFAFSARKGSIYSFEVVARRALSQADPVLRIVDETGKQLAEADDTFGKDPRLEWTAPADGMFRVRITDLHARGGQDFGYVLLAEPARPDFVLTCDPDKLNLGPGGRTNMFVKVERRGGFQGAVTVGLNDLPLGVEATPLTIPPTMTQGEIVLTAARDAAQGGALVSLVGRAESPDGEPITHRSTPQQEIYLPGGGRGLFDVETLAVAVTTPSDVTLEASPQEVVLTPGGKVEIDVTITRREGFDKPVNLAVDLAHLNRVYASGLPPGVSFQATGSKTLLGPNETRGKIVLEAKPDAPPCDGVPIAVMGHVSINFVVKTNASSQAILLKVAPKP
jgi:hypothetical protein